MRRRGRAMVLEKRSALGGLTLQRMKGWSSFYYVYQIVGCSLQGLQLLNPYPPRRRQRALTSRLLFDLVWRAWAQGEVGKDL